MISVDPSSPFTQGALLGDRIRLSDHFLDPGVFIRSMGTRGHLGGLAEATLQAALLLDAAGKELVLLETVGAGQSEVEVIGIADTVLLVLMPGSGDSVQALKAGIMEIPDVIAINKMDHPAAKTMLNEVRSILALDRERAWRPPIVLTEAMRGENVPRALGEDRGASRLPRGRRAAGGAAAQEPRRRGVRGRVEPGKAAPPGGGGREAGATRGCSTRCRRASSTPSRRSGRSWSRCTELTTTRRAPTLADLEAARARIDGIARVTPVYPSETLSRLAGRPVQLKAENLQRTGAFKIRGAVNTIALADAGGARRRASSPRAPGTTARRSRGRRARPGSRRRSSCRRTRRWRRSTRRGTTARGSSSSVPASTSRSPPRRSTSTSTGATFVHAFEDERVIAGQGTIGLELAEQLPDIGTLVIPIGGGGLASGIAIALRALRPDVRLVGVQAEACARSRAAPTTATRSRRGSPSSSRAR